MIEGTAMGNDIDICTEAVLPVYRSIEVKRMLVVITKVCAGIITIVSHSG